MMAHWFHDMTPAQKKAYLAAHPNSKFHSKSTRKIPTGRMPRMGIAGRSHKLAKEASLKSGKKKTKADHVKKKKALEKQALSLHDRIASMKSLIKKAPTASSKRVAKGMLEMLQEKLASTKSKLRAHIAKHKLSKFS